MNPRGYIIIIAFIILGITTASSVFAQQYYTYVTIAAIIIILFLCGYLKIIDMPETVNKK